MNRFVAFALLSAAPLIAQQSAATTADALKLAADMRASYYHPDALRGLGLDNRFRLRLQAV